MKLYLGLGGTKEIETCRIDICNLLISEGISKEKLVFEVKERTKKLVIRDASRQVENSRIYADIGNIISGGDKGLIQLYEKYSILRTKDFSDFEDEKDFLEIYNLLKDKDILQHSHIVHVINSPLNEKNSTFLSLLKRVRDEFAFGDKGLNSYLSTRIRHGHLPTTLRKPVADEKLLSTKIGKTSAYKGNEYWMSQLVLTTSEDTKKIEKAFNEFTTKYELIINEVNDNWLQIITLDQDLSSFAKSTGKPESLFNYSVSNLESFVLQSKLSSDADYDELIRYVTDWLWARTESNLIKVKAKLGEEIRAKINYLLDELHKAVSDITADNSILLNLNASVARSRVGLNASLEQILSWFTRSENNLVEKFEFDTAIEIAEKCANVQVSVEKDRSYAFSGNVLSPFVDMLYILFENAISKSNILKKDVVISVNILSTNMDYLTMNITNNIAPIEDINIANKALDFYRNNYGNEHVMKSIIHGEGGSGLFKIWRILKKDLELDHKIKFEYETSNQFAVNIEIFNPCKVVL